MRTLQTTLYVVKHHHIIVWYFQIVWVLKAYFACLATNGHNETPHTTLHVEVVAPKWILWDRFLTSFPVENIIILCDISRSCEYSILIGLDWWPVTTMKHSIQPYPVGGGCTKWLLQDPFLICFRVENIMDLWINPTWYWCHLSMVGCYAAGHSDYIVAYG